MKTRKFMKEQSKNMSNLELKALNKAKLNKLKGGEIIGSGKPTDQA